MEIDEDIINALFALISLSMFFIFFAFGTIISSLNEDNFMYIEYNPKEDLFYIFGILSLNLGFLGYQLLKASNFRYSRNLNKRYGEILVNSDKMMIYSVPLIILNLFLLYFYMKYFLSSLAFNILLIMISELILIALIFYNSIKIRRDYREELLEK
ncbi:MAG: hypothetical protein ACP6IY_00235 [Promethearchaeia archaeon]